MKFIIVMVMMEVNYHPNHLIIKLSPTYNQIAISNLKEIWDNGCAKTLYGKEFGIPSY